MPQASLLFTRCFSNVNITCECLHTVDFLSTIGNEELNELCCMLRKRGRGLCSLKCGDRKCVCGRWMTWCLQNTFPVHFTLLDAVGVQSPTENVSPLLLLLTPASLIHRGLKKIINLLKTLFSLCCFICFYNLWFSNVNFVANYIVSRWYSTHWKDLRIYQETHLLTYPQSSPFPYPLGRSHFPQAQVLVWLVSQQSTVKNTRVILRWVPMKNLISSFFFVDILIA